MIRFAKFSYITWTHDNKGFFYQVNDAIQNVILRSLSSIVQRYPERVSHGDASSDKAGTETTSDVDAELYYHRVGTPQCKRFACSWILLCNSGLDAYVQLTTFWSSRTQNDQIGCGLPPFPKSTVVILKLPSARTRLECVHSLPCSLIYDQHHSFCLCYFAQKNLLWVADLEKDEIGPNLKWTKFINEFDASYETLVSFVRCISSILSASLLFPPEASETMVHCSTC